jgi:hypothetical protein
MTHNYLPVAGPPQRGEILPPASADEPGTADVVRDQASDVSRSAVQAGKHVADVASELASAVAPEAGREGEDLLRQAQGQLRQPAAPGQQQANRLFSLSDEPCQMAGASGQGGMAAGVASQAASRVRAARQVLQERKPGQMADEVESFAPVGRAIFLVLAAGAGLVAGRLTRVLKGADSDSGALPSREGRPPVTDDQAGRQETP